jgi:hypothetical protein
MKAFTTLAFLAASVAAQTATVPSGSSSTGSSSCAAQSIVDACLGTERGLLASCQTTDYKCQCQAYQNIVTCVVSLFSFSSSMCMAILEHATDVSLRCSCYNNCPGDPEVNSAQGQVQIFCAYATQFASTTTAASTGSQSAPASTASPTTAGSSSTSGTATAASASATKSNGAAQLALDAGGVLAAVAGIVAAVL